MDKQDDHRLVEDFFSDPYLTTLSQTDVSDREESDSQDSDENVTCLKSDSYMTSRKKNVSQEKNPFKYSSLGERPPKYIDVKERSKFRHYTSYQDSFNTSGADNAEQFYKSGRAWTHSSNTPKHIMQDADGPKQNMKVIYEEISEINAKLKMEFKLLEQKEHLLKQRESELIAAKMSWDRAIGKEVLKRSSELHKEHEIDIKKMDTIIKDKDKENKRLKESFDTLKIANDTLKEKLECLQLQHSKLEKQSSSLQARFTNLQRKKERDDRKDFLPADLGKQKKITKDAGKVGIKDPLIKAQPKAAMESHELLSVLLEWLCEVHLRQAITEHPTKPSEFFSNPEFIQEKSMKILPSMVEIIKVLPSNPALALPYLQFTYWALVHLDQAQGHQKTSLSSTLRRLGEELYKPRIVKFNDDESGANDQMDIRHTTMTQKTERKEPRENSFFRSSNLHVRMLSTFIIIKTLTQVDLVANVFDMLRSDLKHQPAKELFLYYQATDVCLPFVKASNKTLTHCVIDVFLQMTMESPSTNSFLSSCSRKAWFRACSMVFRMPNTEEKLLEKLSIIFQKLSKIRTNRRFFEVYGIGSAVQEMLRTRSTENAFLTLNLKSTHFNLAGKLASTKPATANS